MDLTVPSLGKTILGPEAKLTHTHTLFLDSLKMHNKRKVANIMMKWLNFEWNRSMKDAEGFEKSPFNTNTMKLIAPKGMSPLLTLNFSTTSINVAILQFRIRKMAVIVVCLSEGTPTTYTLCGIESFLVLTLRICS